jgi:hypothetical protein
MRLFSTPISSQLAERWCDSPAGIKASPSVSSTVASSRVMLGDDAPIPTSPLVLSYHSGESQLQMFWLVVCEDGTPATDVRHLGLFFFSLT